MRAAWQIHNLCRMEKQEPTPLKKLIRAFFWGNELKAFPLLKSAIFAFPHERHLKPTTATTTWNSKQKPKSAIFCFFSHSFSLKPWKLRGIVVFLHHKSVKRFKRRWIWNGQKTSINGHRTSTGGNSGNEGISFSAQVYFSPCPRKNFSVGREK